ncbi:MAG TPA: hypothetical protein VGR27_09930 [Longimicrobiaceae bacterium]|nr:hypothetical protein [Longimicrobiaceae bacterium]
MRSLDQRLQALERRTEEAERVRVRFFTNDGRELGTDGRPTGRTLADFEPDPEAITVQMDFSEDRERAKWYIGIDPTEI